MRCAASATASAISEPRRDALDTTLLAACCAVSAASTPASRILRRAAGLALIAAAAAASPAASISRLIAALVILSTALSLRVDEDEERLLEDLEDPLRVLDFAIANLPSVRDRRHFRSARVPFRRRTEPHKAAISHPDASRCVQAPGVKLRGCRIARANVSKGTAGFPGDPLEHGQRPEVTAVRSAPTADEHPFPTSLLNHETSDHLLSLR